MMIMNNLNDDVAKAQVAYLLWYIWKSRCWELYEHKAPDLSWVISSASSAVNDLWTAKGWSQTNQEELEPRSNEALPPCFTEATTLLGGCKKCWGIKD
ncbi:hypothetical protein K1719_026574 [Acacia pycnantha]|nr:hypothetical protein K1719_026574 [Acacia pycnantha]